MTIRRRLKKSSHLRIEMIDDETVERAKNSPIIAIANRLVAELKGKLCRCLSPNHEDKNPSMSFKTETNTFKCFSCGFTGDTIALVRQARNCTFTEAVGFILNESLDQTSANRQNAQKDPLKHVLSDADKKGEKYADIYDYLDRKSVV